MAELASLQSVHRNHLRTKHRNTIHDKMEGGIFLCLGMLWSGIFSTLVCYYFDWIFFLTIGLCLIATVLLLYNGASYVDPMAFVFVVVFSFVFLLFIFVVQCVIVELYCYNFECCRSSWIPANITGLVTALNSGLYGQPLVNIPVVTLIRSHLESERTRPLVLSFHGPSGTGKTLTSRLIADNIYKKGMASQFVHFLQTSKDFPRDDMVDQYKEMFQAMVMNSIGRCPQTMFILDEVDNMPVGLIDVFKPFLDFHERLDGTDYRSTIFIFLSNAGKLSLEQTVSGKDRHSLVLKDVEKAVVNNITATHPLLKSGIIGSNLISAYVPFLPLETSHVTKCIKDGLLIKGYFKSEYQIDDLTVEKIRNEIDFTKFNSRSSTLFSTSGCKRVMEKIELVMQHN